MRRVVRWRGARWARFAILTVIIGLVSSFPIRGQSTDAPGGDEVLATDRNLVLTVGKSLSIDSPLAITRVAAANESVVEFVVIGPRELLVNGKAPGETSIVVWREDESRVMYDLTVRPSLSHLTAVRRQIAREFGSSNIEVTVDNETAFVRGTVKDVVSADRVISIVSTLGKVVNLLRVSIPPMEPQILLMVRFASVDRSAGLNLGVNLASGAFNQSTAIGTGSVVSQDGAKTFSLSQAVNILLFRKDINLLAAIQALETKNLLEMLAEPNLLVINGTQAHFVAGGEFPYPMVQPGASGNSVTIAFKEYGIRLGFLPVVTPRGTIRLQVSPEVSSLDYTNSVTIGGTTIPGTSTRRVQTEVELESGQSFVIAGLLDKQTTDSLSKVPGIGSLPVLGKLFQSKAVSRSHSELLVMITPEIVRPIPEGQPLPDIDNRELRRSVDSSSSVRQPGTDKTGPVAVHPSSSDSLPIETLTAPPKKTPPAPVAPASGSGN
jgi:pilus assembly protein CpaC